MQEFYWGVPPETTPLRVGVKQDWQRELLNCDEVASEASADPRGSSGDGMALQNCPEWREGSGPLHSSILPPHQMR